MTSGSRTLKDAVNEAMREWVATVDTTHYCLGSVMGPHPFPYMVRQLQRVVGEEARGQCAELLERCGARRRGGLRRRRLECGGDVRRLRRHPGPAGRRRSGRWCRRDQRHPGRPARHALPAARRTRPGRSRRPSRSRPGWTIRVSGPSTPTWPPSDGPSTRWPRTTRSSTPSACSATPRASFPLSSRPTPWPGWPGTPAPTPCRRDPRCSSPCRAGATRTWPRCARSSVAERDA